MHPTFYIEKRFFLLVGFAEENVLLAVINNIRRTMEETSRYWVKSNNVRRLTFYD